MSTELQAALRSEAVKFADQFYETAMRLFAQQFTVHSSAPPAPPPPPVSGTKKRRGISTEDAEAVLASIIRVLEQHPKGLRIENIKSELGDNLEKALVVKAVKLGLESDQLTKSGERRATTYRAAVPPSPGQVAGRVVKRRKAA